ncbi:DUF771 domain-containing protein [Loigolactobacillus backii]|uniref:DUF771 domain-containing protein n=1 Tax=Loigolactobacillus backii TaxID=375175 RepID=UPI0022FD9702|nr:DUF771 domain-containing protein [Loigolactobacillus backii]MDA5386982.1 DUF771 domain-containing protein [Loigolactobacillus backii]MDA5389520.1 DUF771 domain-containing protein [Loigolactobacillus backii]
MAQIIPTTGSIEISDNYAVVDQNRLEELEREALTARTWTLSDLQERLPRKNGDWLIKHIVDNPKFSREIQKMRDDQVIIGGGKGSNWKFQASVFGPWLDKHWKDIKW